MYLAIDIGGTKTLVAALNNDGVIHEQIRFPTPKDYQLFLDTLATTVDKLTTKKFIASGVGAPGKIDRKHGIVIAFGNLPWRNVPLRDDIKRIVGTNVVVENDANLAGLSEAMLLTYKKVLYVTVSTGIGTGVIIDKKISPDLADSEGGDMLLEHDGKLLAWERFASGSAIVKQFGQRASEITDKKIWHTIAHNLALGFVDLIALIEPDVIVLGGGVGTHYQHYKDFLDTELKSYETPLLAKPVIQEAARPEEAVIFGCYDLAKEVYGKTDH